MEASAVQRDDCDDCNCCQYDPDHQLFCVRDDQTSSHTLKPSETDMLGDSKRKLLDTKPKPKCPKHGMES